MPRVVHFKQKTEKAQMRADVLSTMLDLPIHIVKHTVRPTVHPPLVSLLITANGAVEVLLAAATPNTQPTDD